MRRAEPADLPHLVELARRHHGEVGETTPFDADSFAATAMHVMTTGAAWVCGQSSLGALPVPQIYNRRHLIVCEVWWNSFDGRGREFLAVAERWARKVGAHEVQLSVVADYRPEAMGRLMRARGYAPCTSMYRKEIG